MSQEHAYHRGVAGDPPGAGAPQDDPQALPSAPDDEELVEEEYFLYTTESDSPITVPQGAIEYARATGRRKQAVARVILKPGTGTWRINGRPLANYFPNPLHQQLIREPLEVVGRTNDFDVIVRIHGGGISGQAGAMRLGIARALNSIDAPSYRPVLKRRGFLTRDARVVERKKAGLKKARKAPQFSKR